MKILHHFLPFILYVSVFFSCQPENNKEKTETEKPNFIFIVSEDNSAFLGCYGDPYANTPNLDNLASDGIMYTNAFAAAPVCAPSRSSLITGMYASSLGSHHMRSLVTIPGEFHFFPYYLRQNGYYTVNRNKKDYNIVDQDSVWDDDQWWEYSGMLKDRKEGQPFFAMFNTFMSHESKIHGKREDDMLPYFKDAAIKSMTGKAPSQAHIDSFNYMHQPGEVPVAPYHPDTPEMQEDWARYYDCISMMDDEIGALLTNLKRDNLLDNTIVFYFSDHGGVLGRSKRFTFESGLRIPFIVWLPEKYQHLSDIKPGSQTNRLITLVDLAPTVLNLANIEIPGHFQGLPFLGNNANEKRDYAFGFRGRMDERYDFCRTVRDKKYRYIRNYMPHRPWGQHINYLWRAKSVRSWEDAYQAGNTNKIQSRFWEPKPAEELYDIEADPHNVTNLAYDPDFEKVLEKFRKVNEAWLIEMNDKNFIPEGEYLKNLKDNTGYEYYTGKKYNLQHIMAVADVATRGNAENMPQLEKALEDNDPVVRYWGAVGCCVLKQNAIELKDKLLVSLEDVSMDVRIASAEALYFMNEKQPAKKTLQVILQNKDFIPYGSMEAIRCHALNVVDLMDPEDKVFFKAEIEYLASREEKGYDKRVAEYLMTQGLF